MSGLRLSEQQIADFREKGFLIGLPVFNDNEVSQLNEGYKEVTRLLKPGEKHTIINGWHESSKWLFDISTHPQILDYVEGILGPDFYLWGTHFFSKPPNSRDHVAWHQDAYYWPLSPHNTVTVWLAFLDSDEENGAMKVIPGTHKAGLIKHKRSSNENNVLYLELEEGTFPEDQAVSLNLKAGQISLHDDAIVHGSSANRSDRWRIGLTMRYSTPDVKCDTSVWPNFSVYMVRGTDKYNLNRAGVIPVKSIARPHQ